MLLAYPGIAFGFCICISRCRFLLRYGIAGNGKKLIDSSNTWTCTESWSVFSFVTPTLTITKFYILLVLYFFYCLFSVSVLIFFLFSVQSPFPNAQTLRNIVYLSIFFCSIQSCLYERDFKLNEYLVLLVNTIRCIDMNIHRFLYSFGPIVKSILAAVPC